MDLSNTQVLARMLRDGRIGLAVIRAAEAGEPVGYDSIAVVNQRDNLLVSLLHNGELRLMVDGDFGRMLEEARMFFFPSGQ